MAQLARDAGGSLYKAVSPEGDPQLETLLGVLNALGVNLSVSFPEPRSSARGEG